LHQLHHSMKGTLARASSPVSSPPLTATSLIRFRSRYLRAKRAGRKGQSGALVCNRARVQPATSLAAGGVSPRQPLPLMLLSRSSSRSLRSHVRVQAAQVLEAHVALRQRLRAAGARRQHGLLPHEPVVAGALLPPQHVERQAHVAVVAASEELCVRASKAKERVSAGRPSGSGRVIG
jgi:hypothetical protein